MQIIVYVNFDRNHRWKRNKILLLVWEKKLDMAGFGHVAWSFRIYMYLSFVYLEPHFNVITRPVLKKALWNGMGDWIGVPPFDFPQRLFPFEILILQFIPLRINFSTPYGALALRRKLDGKSQPLTPVLFKGSEQRERDVRNVSLEITPYCSPLQNYEFKRKKSVG